MLAERCTLLLAASAGELFAAALLASAAPGRPALVAKARAGKSLGEDLASTSLYKRPHRSEALMTL